MSWLTQSSNGIFQWLQERLAGNTAAAAAKGSSTSQHSGGQFCKPPGTRRKAPTPPLLPLDLPLLQLQQQQGPRPLQLPSAPPACHCVGDSRTKPSRLRQSITQAASKLSCKTVVDLNSGLCSTELAWHVRAQQQQIRPARMAVKMSNRHKTRVTFDAQVALRNTAGAVLRLAGSPQGMHAASILIKPAAPAQGGSPPSTPADEATTHHAESAASHMRHGHSSRSSSRSSSSGDPQHNGQAVPSSSSSSSSSNITMQQGSRRRQPRQRGRIAAWASPNTLKQPNAGSGSHQHTGAPTGVQRQLAGSTAVAVPAQVQWEVGWNWKAAGPIALVTKQLSDSTTPSGSTGGTAVSTPWRAVQQLKLAYDPKAHSYTLTAGGEGWNVMLAVPTRDTGLGALVPSVCQAGCRPKLTLSLVPDVCCF